MEDVMSTISCHPENQCSNSSAVFIVSSSWDDFVQQAASSYSLNSESCILLTESGVVVNNFRALRVLSSQAKTTLLLKGIPLSESQKSPREASNTILEFEKQSVGIPREQLSSSLLSGSLHEDEDSRASTSSSANSSPTPSTSSSNSESTSYSASSYASDSLESRSTETVEEYTPNMPRHMSATTASKESTNEQYYPVPEILCQMRATQGQNKFTKSAEDLIRDLQTAPSFNDIKLVRKAVTWWLMLHCNQKYYPTRNEYIKMSKSIVNYFPLTGNSRSSNPWDAFFDPKSGISQLDCYARNKRSRDGLSRAQENHHSKRRKTASTQQQEYSENEVKDAEMFMRQHVVSPQNQRIMIENFKITRHVRISLLEDKSKTAVYILKRFPLLIEMLEAVDEDLMFLQKTSVATFLINWRKIYQQLIDLGKKRLKSKSDKDLVEKIELAMESFDSVEQNRLILILLTRLLSNSPKNNKEDTDLAESSIISSMFQKFKDGTSIEEANEAGDSKMKELGLIMIGSKFYIKCHDMVFELRVKLFDEAIGYLVSYFYVLHQHYPKDTKFVFSFLERIFGMAPSVQSRAVTALLNCLVY